ncbi:MAG: M20/M25/M40 family metallo-hydrolase [Anaerolineales bacterium]|nr:M20/M25/M40 family metallo-hydrolase [Anaerolineales bacterium]
MEKSAQVQGYLQGKLDEYLDVLRRMVAINSFTANAAGVNRLGELTAGWFAELGFQAESVPSSNLDFGRHLFLSRPAAGLGARPVVAMVSHLDTVFPPEEEERHQFHWRVEDKRIYGPGTVDIKGGTALMYMVLDGLRTFYPQVFEAVDWRLCFNASEERLTDDFGQACFQRLPANTLACLVFEGGNIKDEKFLLVTARKGRATFRVSVEGRSAHAGNNHANGANAIVQMAHTIQKIAALTDYSQQLTFNVGWVRGGVVVNRVPHFAEAEVEMRTFTAAIFDGGVRRMLALNGVSDVVSADGFACKVSVQLLDQSAPWPPNAHTENLYAVWERTARALGMQVEREERGGLSDGNYLCQWYPTLDGLGPAGNNTHCSERDLANGKDQEFVLVSSMAPKATLDVFALLALLKSAG